MPLYSALFAQLLDCSLRSLLSLNPDDAGSALLRQFDAALQLQPSRACLFLDDIDKLLPNAVEQEGEEQPLRWFLSNAALSLVDDDTSAQVLFALQQIFHRLRSCQSASNIVLVCISACCCSRTLRADWHCGLSFEPRFVSFWPQTLCRHGGHCTANAVGAAPAHARCVDTPAERRTVGRRCGVD